MMNLALHPAILAGDELTASDLRQPDKLSSR